ncbi:uncharacterized protein LOC115223539 isoform X2 [Octopus sinensis]|uniref:Uncharacterized protein LOC115223539 isoform X2 n=1 Tax=Octopus sinensis TaxID=2607531 RepID=A0A7E6EM87_9MOLL|nr:uncharacterized protein LOC115223539 isoform X2 [Octopus sinensis]
MNVYANIFSSESMSNSEYVMVLLTFWNKFHSNLREKQSKCLNKIKWGEPVLTGKHGLSTLDRKQRIGKNILDSEENTLSGDEEIKSEEQVPSKKDDVSVAANPININISEEHSRCSSPDLNKSVLRLPKLKIKLSETHNKELHKNIADDKSESIEIKRSTRLSVKRLCNKKQVNKENVNSGVRPNLLQRRKLFKNNEGVSEASPTCWTGVKCPLLKDTPKTEPMHSKLGQETLPHFSENISDINPSMEKMEFKTSLPIPGIQKSPVKKSSADEPSTLSPVELVESSKHELQESQKLSKPVEKDVSDDVIPSASPTFPSKTLPSYKDNSSMAQTAKEQTSDIDLGSKKTRKRSKTEFKNSSEEPEITDKCDTKNNNEVLPHVTDENNKDNEVLTNLQKRKRNMQDRSLKINKKLKLPQKKPTVQCPLCCDWFRPKVIENHAANCGMFTRRELRTTSVPQLLSENKPSTDMLGCDANSKLFEINENSAAIISNHATNYERVVDNLTSNTLVSDIKQSENLPFASKILNESRSEINTFPVSALDRDQLSQGNGNSLKIVQPVLDLPFNSENTHKTNQPDTPDSVTPELLAEDFTEISPNNPYSTKVSVEHWKTNSELIDTNLTMKQKRCYICDATYGDDSLFTMHLKSCQEKYRKLKQKFEHKYKNKETHRITRRRLNEKYEDDK